jgi:alpha-ketoglutarate-dependent taurine dioxygenase
MAQTKLNSQRTAGDWPFQVKPLHPVLGCEITGVTLAEAVSSAIFARVLIEELNIAITLPARIYTHRWSPRQCMVWDNRCLLHRATDFDETNQKRVMRRCTINGDQPY